MTGDKPYLIITWKTMKTIVVIANIVVIILAVMTSLSVAVLGRNTVTQYVTVCLVSHVAHKHASVLHVTERVQTLNSKIP